MLAAITERTGGTLEIPVGLQERLTKAKQSGNYQRELDRNYADVLAVCAQLFASAQSEIDALDICQGGSLTDFGKLVQDAMLQTVQSFESTFNMLSSKGATEITIVYRNALASTMFRDLRRAGVFASAVEDAKVSVRFHAIASDRGSADDIGLDELPDILLQYSRISDSRYSCDRVSSEKLRLYQKVPRRSSKADPYRHDAEYLHVDRGDAFAEKLRSLHYPTNFVEAKWRYGVIQHAVEHFLGQDWSMIHMSPLQRTQFVSESARVVEITASSGLPDIGINREIFLAHRNSDGMTEQRAGLLSKLVADIIDTV